MTIHGDLYYEGKEFETRLKEKKPGDLSEELRTALGMPIGPNCHKIPPPWLIAQQRCISLIEFRKFLFGKSIKYFKFQFQIRSATKLSKSQNSWLKCAHSRGMFIWISCGRLGKTTGRREGKTIVWRCVWHKFIGC